MWKRYQAGRHSWDCIGHSHKWRAVSGPLSYSRHCVLSRTIWLGAVTTLSWSKGSGVQSRASFLLCAFFLLYGSPVIFGGCEVWKLMVKIAILDSYGRSGSGWWRVAGQGEAMHQ